MGYVWFSLVVSLFLITCKTEEYIAETLVCGEFKIYDLNNEVSDTFTAGDILFYSDEELNFSSNCESRNMLEITKSADMTNRTSVILSAPLASYCTSLIHCDFDCPRHTLLAVRAPIRITQTYFLRFTDLVYKASVQKNAPNRTWVKLDNEPNVVVDNCTGPLMFPYYSARYQLLKETVNITPFVWMAETRNNDLGVNGLIDGSVPSYNLSLTAVLANNQNQRIQGQAYTRIIISVVDNNTQCNINPCQNNGTCVYLTSSYMCSCRTGWSGMHCERDVLPPVILGECPHNITILSSNLASLQGWSEPTFEDPHGGEVRVTHNSSRLSRAFPTDFPRVEHSFTFEASKPSNGLFTSCFYTVTIILDDVGYIVTDCSNLSVIIGMTLGPLTFILIVTLVIVLIVTRRNIRTAKRDLNKPEYTMSTHFTQPEVPEYSTLDNTHDIARTRTDLF